MENVGEAVQEAVTTATVGAAFLNPLPVRNQTTTPADTGEKMQITDTKQFQ